MRKPCVEMSRPEAGSVQEPARHSLRTRLTVGHVARIRGTRALAPQRDGRARISSIISSARRESGTRKYSPDRKRALFNCERGASQTRFLMDDLVKSHEAHSAGAIAGQDGELKQARARYGM